MLMEASLLDTLVLMVPSERKLEELTVSLEENMDTLILMV
jgi:hypothetical protein